MISRSLKIYKIAQKYVSSHLLQIMSFHLLLLNMVHDGLYTIIDPCLKKYEFSVEKSINYSKYSVSSYKNNNDAVATFVS